MRRSSRITIAAAAVLGLLAGVVLTLSATSPSKEAAGTTAEPDSSPTSDASDASDPAGTQPAGPAKVHRSTTLLAWISGGLPPGFATAVDSLDLVEDLTAVSGGQADMVRSVRAVGTVVDSLDDGWAIPLDTIAIDPSTFRAFVDPAARATIADLRPGQAIMTQSSLVLRRLDVGSSVELRGGSVGIVGVVDDHAGAGAELIVHIEDADRLGVATQRYVVAHHAPGQRAEVTDAVAELAGAAAIRFRTPAETTWLRHGDAVTPQVFVKEAFGEFAYRDRAGRDIEIDVGWIDTHIVEAEVPVLGRVRCHRAMVEPLETALSALTDENLGHLVDPAGFAGCWSPRRIEEGQPLSRHAWGIAVDLNIDGNPRGSFSNQDARLVDAMRSAGFTWGGLWLVPDPGHYELVPR